MKKGIYNFFRIEGNRSYFELFLYLFVASLPMGYSLDGIFLAGLVLSWCFVSTWERKIQNLKNNKLSLGLLFVMFVIFLAGILYSEQPKVALGRVERSLTLIVLPLLVFSLDKAFFNFKRIYLSLGLGLCITMLVSWAFIFIDILSKPWPLRQAKYFFEWIYTHDNLLRPMDIHPGYFAFSLVIFAAGLIGLNELHGLRKRKGLYFLILFLLVLFLIETSSRFGFIAFFLVIIINIFRKKSKKAIWSMLFLITITFVIASQFNYLKTKFNKVIDENGSIKFERFHRWKSILDTFSESNQWIFGVGNGDVYEVYQQAYQEGGFSLALRDNYNAHNQYLELLIGCGVIGLFIYITIIVNFIKETRLKNQALIFFLLVILFSLSESFLVRSKGVLIFAFFYAMFISKLNQNND